MIVNFAVKQQGLEAQLLSTVVKQERADLDRQKNELVIKVAQGKRTQVGCHVDISCLCSCMQVSTQPCPYSIQSPPFHLYHSIMSHICARPCNLHYHQCSTFSSTLWPLLSHFALQAELEDEILQLLSSATGNLLDNVQLINTLNASKTTWEQVNQSLQVCSYLVMLMPCLLYSCLVHDHTLQQHASSQTLLHHP